jgi:hypothetical protein
MLDQFEEKHRIRFGEKEVPTMGDDDTDPTPADSETKVRWIAVCSGPTSEARVQVAEQNVHGDHENERKYCCQAAGCQLQ